MLDYLINRPNLSELERKFVLEVLESSWLSAGGKHTQDFEHKFSEYLGVKHSIAVQSGTAALHVALRALGVGPKDHVITPNGSCGASVSAVTQCGAIPVLLDVEPETYAMSAENLESALKKYSPKAVQLVHVYGFPARDTLKIKELCSQYGVFLLEDTAEALGATLEGTKVGSFGDIATFSIRSEKMIGVGEGGVVSTNNSGLFSRVSQLASRAAPFRTRESPYWSKYFYDGEGYNYKLPHLLGALAHAQIMRFSEEILPQKIRVGESFRQIFSGSDHWDLQTISDGCKPVYWLNSLKFRNFSKDQVRALGEQLYKEGVEVRSGFWPLSEISSLGTISHGLQETGWELFEKLLILPSSYDLSDDNMKDILGRTIQIIESNQWGQR